MAKSSSHNTSSPEITRKEELVTLDKLESPNPFLPVTQVEFTFEEIAFTTNNEVALLYPSHPNQEYFKDVSDFISKCCLKEAFTRSSTQYKEYLSKFWYTTKTLEDSKVWVSTPTSGVRGDIEPPFTTYMKAICKLDVPVVSKALKPSSQTEEVPQGKKPGAKSGLKRKQSSKHTSESQTEAFKSKTGQSETETKSSSAKDKSPSHPSPPTPVVGEMDKEAQQAAGVPTSLGATSKEGAHPQLSSSTNEESRADDISKKIKLKDLSEFLKDIRSALFTLDSPQDDPIIVTYESEEKEADKEDTHDTSHDMPEDTSVPPPSSPKSAQIQELMAQARHSYPDVNQLTTLLVTSLKPKPPKSWPHITLLAAYQLN
ncbi:hypothetical protein Tco_1379827 [Tanacetum coccineum]